MRTQIARIFWPGIAVTTLGLLTYYVHRTPLVFILDMRWPSFTSSIAIAVGGLILTAAGIYGNRTRTRVVALTLSTVVIALTAATNLLVYREHSAQFSSGDADLSGTLLIPRGTGPHPAAIIVHGTAPTARTPYRGLAEMLVRQGVAALTYDKRGFAASTGPLPYRYDDLAIDVQAAVEHLKNHSTIDADRIGLIGFSEGGFVSPLAASQSSDIAFMAIVSGGGVSPARTVIYEMETRLQKNGYGESVIERAKEIRDSIHTYYRTGEGGEAAYEAIHAVKTEPWFTPAFEIAPDDLPPSIDEIQYTADYPADLDFDPIAHLKVLDIPMLFLFGEADEQLPAAESAEAIRNALTNARRSDFKIEVFPGADHLIMVDYKFAPGYLETLTDWLKNSVGTEIPQRVR